MSRLTLANIIDNEMPQLSISSADLHDPQLITDWTRRGCSSLSRIFIASSAFPFSSLKLGVDPNPYLNVRAVIGPRRDERVVVNLNFTLVVIQSFGTFSKPLFASHQ